MKAPRHLYFLPFHLDFEDERLWRETQVIRLSHKSFSVLRCLVTKAGQLVTKDVLFESVWPDTIVSDSVLSSAIRELRQAFGDQARTPHFIETVHGRGYRFIAPVTPVVPAEDQQLEVPSHPSKTPPIGSPITFVGRESELSQLHQWFAASLEGKRQIGFITGDAGIGKTALVETFVAHVVAETELWVGHGQCIDLYGEGEAYLPMLDALGRLCRGPEGDRILTFLRQYAPSWLVQMPTLLSLAEQEGLRRTEGGATQTRMLRELAEALEMLTAERPLLLILEDLHWSDVSTLDWLSFVARRRDPARLLILSTYRPVEAIVHKHPLHTVTQELYQQGHGVELALDYLSEARVETYLVQRFGEVPLLARLAQALHQRTSGNPLFMITVVDELVRQGVLSIDDEGWNVPEGLEKITQVVPSSARQMIEQQLEKMVPMDQELLGVASVVGTIFSIAAVAAGIELEEDTLEARFTTLARQGQFVQEHEIEEWPDGTVAASYRFRHALYHEVLYWRLSTGRRMRLHQQIGARKEMAYGDQASSIAAELAAHFVQGRDARRAGRYLQWAGENALRFSAHQEAIAHLTQGLELLQATPDGPDRTKLELLLLTHLGPAFMTVKGFGSSEVEQVYSRAKELCGQLGDSSVHFQVLWGLYAFYLIRGELQAARQQAEQCLALAERIDDRALLLEAYRAMGVTSVFMGNPAHGCTDSARSMHLYDSSQYHAHASLYGTDPGTACCEFTGWALWILGYPDQALQQSKQAIKLAQDLSHPYSLVEALAFATGHYQFRREVQAVQQQAERVIAITAEHAFPFYSTWGTVFRGWCLALLGQGDAGIAQMCQGMTAYQATGGEICRSYMLALLAEVYGKTGQPLEGLESLAEALTIVEKSGERFYEAELYRLRGELVLNKLTGDQDEAEACFQQALCVARLQQAKSFELRTAMNLARLWQRQGKRPAAYDLLAPLCGWFTEGFNTADLKEAKALLVDLSERP